MDKKTNITTKFADFKDEKIKKFKKTKEFEPLSDDIIALQELEDGEIEKIKEPIKIIQVTGIVTDTKKIKKLEEAISGGPTFNTELKVGQVKRGDIIWVTALLERPSKSATWSSQATYGVLKCRIVDLFFGLNKLKYI